MEQHRHKIRNATNALEIHVNELKYFDRYTTQSRCSKIYFLQNDCINMAYTIESPYNKVFSPELFTRGPFY